jgi:hypothetical protein
VGKVDFGDSLQGQPFHESGLDLVFGGFHASFGIGASRHSQYRPLWLKTSRSWINP